MSEFEFSTLGMLLLILAGLAGYSYWQVRAARQAESVEFIEHVTPTMNLPMRADLLPIETVELDDARPIFMDEMPFVATEEAADTNTPSALAVFTPLLRFAAWHKHNHLSPVASIDAVIEIVLSQPKNSGHIEEALEDLYLDSDLPLRLYGRRSGQEEAQWQILEAGALYRGLRLTLQLTNRTTYADELVLQAWVVLAQKLTKRLAAHVVQWPEVAQLNQRALMLHQLAQHLAEPLVVQLRKPAGLWPAYEVHQCMTQLGVSLNERGHYVAHAPDGKVIYTALNDIGNPSAQDFRTDALPAMLVNTLSFCLDLARLDVAYQPSLRLWHDMTQLAQALQGQWCNAQHQALDVPALMVLADEHINAYYQQLHDLNLPAGSLMVRRLLRGTRDS
ncbi:MAG: hypothetical protein ACRCV6_09475 [Formosimonas sp.]